MKNDEIRDKLHKMRGSLSVLTGFLSTFEPKDEDERLHHEAAQKSLEKLGGAVEELSQLISSNS